MAHLRKVNYHQCTLSQEREDLESRETCAKTTTHARGIPRATPFPIEARNESRIPKKQKTLPAGEFFTSGTTKPKIHRFESNWSKLEIRDRSWLNDSCCETREHLTFFEETCFLYLYFCWYPEIEYRGVFSIWFILSGSEFLVPNGAWSWVGLTRVRIVLLFYRVQSKTKGARLNYLVCACLLMVLNKTFMEKEDIKTKLRYFCVLIAEYNPSSVGW